MITEEFYIVLVKIVTVSADAYIVFDYFDAFYQRKLQGKRFLAGVIAYMVMMMLTSYIELPYLNVVMAFTMVLFSALFLYSGNVRSKILSAFAYIVFALVCELIIYFSINLLIPATVQELHEVNVFNIHFMIYAKILTFIIFKGVAQMKRSSQNRLLPKDFLALIFVTFISLYIIATLMIEDGISQNTEAVVKFFVSIGLFISNIIIFNLFLKSTKYAKIEIEQSLILQNIESSEKRYGEVIAIQNQIKSMWHDINNHITCVKGMLGSDEGTAARYIDEIEKKVGDYAAQVTFGNSIIDTILYT